MLAILSVRKVGGINVLTEGIATSAQAGPDFLHIMPSFGSISLTFFIVGLTIQ